VTAGWCPAEGPPQRIQSDTPLPSLTAGELRNWIEHAGGTPIKPIKPDAADAFRVEHHSVALQTDVDIAPETRCFVVLLSSGHPPGNGASREAAFPAHLTTVTARLMEQALLMDHLHSRLQRQETVAPHDDVLWREKLESLAEFAAGAGHEINNPLATISGRVEQLLRGETDPDRRRALTTIGGQALRVRDMIGDVMLFARPPKPECESVDVPAAVREVLDKLDAEVRRRGCRLHFTPQSPLTVFADPVQLGVVLENLVRNSLEAVEEQQGEIDIACGTVGDADGGDVWLRVTDNGIGLSEKDRRHLFDPFYSGRQAGRGLGFGLCKCWRIVSNHGGRIEVASQPGRTTFQVLWPAGADEG